MTDTNKLIQTLENILTMDLSIKAKYLLILMKLKPELSSFADLNEFMNITKGSFHTYMRELREKDLIKNQVLRLENGNIAGSKRVLLI